jgi:hypothetical protein
LEKTYDLREPARISTIASSSRKAFTCFSKVAYLFDDRLKDEGSLRIVGRLSADVLDAPFPLVTKKVEAEAVFCGHNLCKQICAEADPLRCVDQTLEDRVLDTLSAIFA